MTQLDILAALNPIIIPMSEVANVPLRICAESRFLKDAIEGTCAECNRQIFFDPGYPDGPKKICLSCAEHATAH